MQTAYNAVPATPSGGGISGFLTRTRDWLDEKGKLAWIAAMVLGFVFVWPVGLFILGYMIWSNRMFSSCKKHRMTRARFVPMTGNAAFDAYREETLKRLEDEHREFMEFLERLREAKDKAEFDQFMEERRRDH